MTNSRLYPVHGDDPRLIGSQATSFTQFDFANKGDAVNSFQLISGTGTVVYNAAGPSVIGAGCFQFTGTGTWITNTLYPVSVDSGVKGTVHYAASSTATLSIGYLSYNSSMVGMSVVPAQNYFLLNSIAISNATLTQIKNTVRGEGASSSQIPTGTRFVQPTISITANAGTVSIDAFILTHFLDDSLPAGVHFAYGGTIAPQGYLMCDGSSVSRTTYASLFTNIGTAYGTADGTHFNLPDLRGRFVRGVDATGTNDPDNTSRSASNLGGNTGAAVGSLQADQFYSHAHSISGGGIGAGTTGNPPHVVQSDAANLGMGTSSAGGSETRPKNVYSNYIIKY